MSRPTALVACEESGVVRDALTAAGFDAMSCDLLPTRRPGKHHQGDVRDVLYSRHWNLLIAHPPCTYLSVSGMHWTTRGKRDPQLTEDALAFVQMFMDAPADHTGIENPVSVISSRIREPDQIVQPWMFGDDASKATCFWLSNLPPLVPTNYTPPRVVLHNGKWAMRWDNQTDSGQNKLPPSEDRAMQRSATYPGIAKAIAQQWGAYVLNSMNVDYFA